MEEKPSGSGSGSDGGIEEPLLKDSEAKGTHEDHEDETGKAPIEEQGFRGYNYGARPYRDIAFAIVFILAALATLGFGIFAIVHHNSDFQWSEPAHYLRNQSRCTVAHSNPSAKLDFLLSHPGRISSWRTLASVVLPERVSSSHGFAVALISSLAVTLVLSVPIVLALVWLLRHYTKEIVYVSLPLFILFPVALNILWFVACAKDSECQDSVSLPVRILFFVFIFAFCAIIVWIIFANFARVELTVRVITTASEALYRNLSLLLVVPSLSLVLLVFYVPAAFFLVFSYMNGKYVPNADLRDRPELPCGRGTSRECCEWNVESWVPAYMTLAALFVVWATCVVAQVKVYTISGTISQWYFAEVDTHTIGAMRRSLGQAFSSSFGTICFSGLLFAFVRLIRNAVDTAKDSQEGEGLAMSFLRCCYEWLLQAIEFVTKFTVDFAAITGEGFCSSAARTYELLKRNLLSTVFVEVISTRLLGGVMVVVSIIYAVAVWGILLGTTSLDSGIYIVTVLSGALLLLILSIYIAIMNIIVDTVYICYAMDKDRGVVSKPEAHDVYVLLPVSQDERASLAVQQGKDDSPV
ncbi:CTL-like protein DDB_G0288717 [Selaginella moellendorffii]|nr:CTL-like protein DDB_G0288717 [Selaginella moellendorffii]|eukprot:XP_002988927.2 CTL-like protein DDB_G0288717 [Selaginella moellendorffii]